MTQKKCFASEQIFVAPDGAISSCCMARKHFRAAGAPTLNNLVKLKEENNRQIAVGDQSACWDECQESHSTSVYFDYRPCKLVIYTNTFCPLRCKYCSLTYPRFQQHSRRPNATVPLVAQPENNTTNLKVIVDSILNSEGGEAIKFVELSGGDTAYHPEFEQLLDYVAARGVKTTYLSSGIVPPEKLEKVVEKVREGMLEVSISADAVTAATWSKIKLRPEKQFKQVVEMIHQIAEINARHMHVKFIVMDENASESERFLPFYSDLGVTSFCISELREEQALFQVTAPDRDVTAKACDGILRSFRSLEFGGCETTMGIVGLEEFFGGQRQFRRV